MRSSRPLSRRPFVALRLPVLGSRPFAGLIVVAASLASTGKAIAQPPDGNFEARNAAGVWFSDPASFIRSTAGEGLPAAWGNWFGSTRAVAGVRGFKQTFVIPGAAADDSQVTFDMAVNPGTATNVWARLIETTTNNENWIQVAIPAGGLPPTAFSLALAAGCPNARVEFIIEDTGAARGRMWIDNVRARCVNFGTGRTAGPIVNPPTANPPSSSSLSFDTVTPSEPPPTYYFAPSDTPALGTCNVFPWGQTSTRHQHVVTAAELGNARRTIRDIGYAACAAGTFTAAQILIRMNHFTGTTLGTDFTVNLGSGAVTMLSSSSFAYTYALDAWADVGLTGSFNYDPALGNLIIDIEFCGGAGGAPFHRDVASRAWLNSGICPSANVGTVGTGALKVRVCTSGGASFIPFGTGCGTPPLILSGTGVPNIGNSVSVAMSNGLGGSPGLYVIGTAPASVDLTGLGATGCTLYTLPVVTVPTGFDGSGNSVPLVLNILSNPSLVGLSLVLTGLDVNPPANPLGMTTANGLTMVIGV